jgi:hypothetical protein
LHKTTFFQILVFTTSTNIELLLWYTEIELWKCDNWKLFVQNYFYNNTWRNLWRKIFWNGRSECIHKYYFIDLFAIKTLVFLLILILCITTDIYRITPCDYCCVCSSFSFSLKETFSNIPFSRSSRQKLGTFDAYV